MDSQKSLSEIAKAILVDKDGENEKTLREKAGVLALLNLLGITESFFAESAISDNTLKIVKEALSMTGKPEVEAAAIDSGEGPGSEKTGNVPITGPQTGQWPGPGDSPLNLIASLVKLMGAPPTQEGTKGAGGILGGLDPAFMSTLMTILAGMSKQRPKALETPTGTDEDKVEDESGGEQNAAGEKPKEVSPLQQFLGVDPKVLTLILNFLAGLDFMKNRRDGTKQDEASVQKPSGVANTKDDTKITLTPDGRDVVVPSNVRRLPPRDRVYHKPGLGIYRTRPASDLRQGRAVT